MNVKEKTLCLEKKFCQDYQNTIDWDSSPAMETEFLKQTFTYDAMNRPLTIKQPDDSVIAHSYNKAGLLETLQAQIRGATTWTDFITNINYNEKGQRTEIYYNNGSKTSYTYDTETFRLTRLLTTRNTGSDILQDINYTYDPEGNITEIEDDAQQTFYFSNTVVEPNGKYYYDALYRLTKAKGRELTSLAMPTDTDFANNLAVPNTASNAMQNYIQHYVYDELGNIEQMASQGQWTRDYYYNTGVNTLKGHTSGTTEYTYDAHGNTLSMPHLTSMAWDYKDQLDEVDLGGGGTLYNIYDAGGQRVRKVVVKTGGIVEQRVYFSGWEIYRKSISGTIDFERCYLRISDDRKAIAEVETKTIENGNTISSPTSNIRFQYDNHLGSACLELDTSAAIISYEEYHPFGTTSYRSGRTETEVSLKRYKYVGKERDEETGLYYYGARYYAGWIARFVSVDPLAGKFPFYSPYQYSGNNPVTFYDLDGHELVENPKTNVEPNGQQKNYLQQIEPAVADKTDFINPYFDYNISQQQQSENSVEFDIEISQGNISLLSGVECSVSTIETGNQNTIWRRNWISIVTESSAPGASIGGSTSWGKIKFNDLDPWTDIPSMLSEALVNELSISTPTIISYSNITGEGYIDGQEVFQYETHGIGVGAGIPITESESIETIFINFGWLPHEIDSIYTALNNPSHAISASVIKSKGLDNKEIVDSLINNDIFFFKQVQRDSLNKIIGNE